MAVFSIIKLCILVTNALTPNHPISPFSFHKNFDSNRNRKHGDQDYGDVEKNWVHDASVPCKLLQSETNRLLIGFV